MRGSDQRRSVQVSYITIPAQERGSTGDAWAQPPSCISSCNLPTVNNGREGLTRWPNVVHQHQIWIDRAGGDTRRRWCDCLVKQRPQHIHIGPRVAWESAAHLHLARARRRDGDVAVELQTFSDSVAQRALTRAKPITVERGRPRTSL